MADVVVDLTRPLRHTAPQALFQGTDARAQVPLIQLEFSMEHHFKQARSAGEFLVNLRSHLLSLSLDLISHGLDNVLAIDVQQAGVLWTLSELPLEQLKAPDVLARGVQGLG